MVKLLCFFLSFILLWTNICYAKINFYFTPSTDCEKHIIKYIDQSQSSLDIVIYSLSNEQIVQAIENAYKRGVEIRILTDRVQAGGRQSKVKHLYNLGIDIRVNSKHKIQHNKLAVFDNAIIVTGSYNWTENASKYNSENCGFITDEPEAVKQITKEINHLWEINSKEKSDKWFNKIR